MSDIATLVLKGDVKLQLTSQPTRECVLFQAGLTTSQLQSVICLHIVI